MTAHRSKRLTVILGLLVGGCSSSEPPRVVVDYYDTAFRQTAPEPVYSRLTWSHLPQPIQKKAGDDAPYLMPVVSFELPNSNLEEALQALAQTIGYRWSYPQELAGRRVSIRRTATVVEVLDEIGKQAGVHTELDHVRRMVRAYDPNMAPRLPGN